MMGAATEKARMPRFSLVLEIVQVIEEMECHGKRVFVEDSRTFRLDGSVLQKIVSAVGH